MTSPEAVFHHPRSVPLRRRLLVRLVVGAARLLANQRPRRIRNVLGLLRRGARPATFEQAQAARDTVVAVSLACAGREGCLPRSLATTLLCRLHGRWPTWCVGARRLPPFSAHAWVEAEGVPVGEDYPADYFRPLFTVPCAVRHQRRESDTSGISGESRRPDESPESRDSSKSRDFHDSRDSQHSRDSQDSHEPVGPEP
ncbi:lasso peptide biosynthesis B2 protein [Streptomyces ficellus]|uniref:lasso peptide biosynthesis B2 protein n=1 Tax=Streptomyces ficellus TaxID=1977088 RepID=UPI003EB89814